MYNFPRLGLGIDFETSGYSLPNYAAKHQGISFGAIVFDMKTFEPVEKLYREIKFDERYEWNHGAERIHGLSREHLNTQGVRQEEAAVDLLRMISKYFGTDEIILLGHRVYFDKAFTNQLLDTIDTELDYHPTLIDSSSIGTVLLETSKSEEIFNTLGLPTRGKHNALEDIEYTLSSVKKMKEAFLIGSFHSSLRAAGALQG